ncbi:MAG: dTDP-4-dehydrorhamnose reductase [Gaiellales bacterium]
MTGAGGQVGRALRSELPGAQFIGHDELDVTDRRAVMARLGGADLVVNCAAMTDVDGCEADPERAMAVNGRGAAHVAAAARRVIQLSTDYVFDGTKDGEYAEDDAPNPQSAYGRSKLEGERAVREAGANLIVRTSWVFGEGRNFIRSVVAAHRAGRTLRVVSDQCGRPTWAGDVAHAVAHLARSGESGVVNVAGDGAPCTWADLAELAVGHQVERVTSEEWGAPAPRPRNSVLALDRARTLGVPLADWRDSVSRYVEGL